jgi:glutamate carboxypeptidase
MEMKLLVAAVAANEPRMRARIRELVEVESPSDDKAAVDRAGALTETWIKQHQGCLKTHKSALYGDVLEAQFGPVRSRSRGRILLLTHVDTVWPVGTLSKMPWRTSDGKLYGPGVLDMKAGIVMAIEALAALQDLGVPLPPVTLLLNSDEEIGSPISRAITERIARRCSAVFVMEPAQGMAFKTARKGVGHFTLHVQGISSHAGVDFENGHSAVLEMARLVQQVSAFTNPHKGLTVNAGVITGGTRSNVIASDCVAEVDVRIAKESGAPSIERMFRSLRTTDRACKLTVSGGINRPPMERKAGTARLFRKAEALAKQMGFVLEEAATGGGSDGNFTAALGIPTLDGMGAVGAGAHAAHEHVVTKHLVERTALLAGMIAAAD